MTVLLSRRQDCLGDPWASDALEGCWPDCVTRQTMVSIALKCSHDEQPNREGAPGQRLRQRVGHIDSAAGIHPQIPGARRQQDLYQPWACRRPRSTCFDGGRVRRFHWRTSRASSSTTDGYAAFVATPRAQSSCTTSGNGRRVETTRRRTWPCSVPCITVRRIPGVILSRSPTAPRIAQFKTMWEAQVRSGRRGGNPGRNGARG